MAIFRFSKIAAAAILDFQILEILTVGTLNRAKLPHLAKFLWNLSNRSRYNCDFSIFQDGGRRHLWFLNFADFNGRNAHDGQTAPQRQILSKSVKPQQRYGDFSIFQYGGSRHLGF